MLKNSIKGWFGEVGVSLGQRIFLNKQIYHQLNNVTIGSKNGTAQIDHIIVSIYGIFVTETKNFSGWIFGDEKNKVWTQSLYGKKSKFQNPLHQNYRHIKVLQEFLGIEEKYFHSIVIFIGESVFKSKMPPNVLDRGYISYIKSKKTELFSKEEVANIVKALQVGKLPKSFKTGREHIHSLKRRYGSTALCPKCGSQLVQRTAKRGKNAGQKFLGCSNFPRCRYSKSMP